MNKKDKKRFLKDAISAFKANLLKSLTDVPESWDTLELSRWAVESFQRAVNPYTAMHGRRLDAYNAEVLMRDL